MKLLADERVKHRLIGITVIISIALIFVPAIMKKSSQRFDEKVRLSVKLPPKPHFPEVAESDKEQVFERVKTMRLAVNEEPEQIKPVTKVAQARPIPQKTLESADAPKAITESLIAEAQKPEPSKIIELARANVHRPVIKHQVVNPVETKQDAVKHKAIKPAPVKSVPKAPAKVHIHNVHSKAINKKGFAVQLASFSNKQNATQLAARLKQQGFTPRINTIANTEGNVYKVVVGHAVKREQAVQLKQKLAQKTQLKGFIVTTEVS